MKIVRSNYYKPCPGVNRAFMLAEQAIRLAQEQNIPAYCLGKLVHNEDVVKKFEERGLLTIGAKDFNLKPGYLVIRAHGVAEGIRRNFEEKGFQIIDATCPRVAKNLKSVKIAASRGKSILVIGNHGHSETKAIRGVELFKGIPVISTVIEVEKDIDDIEDIGMSFFAIPQTTFNLENYNYFKNKLSSNFTDIEFEDGLCHFCLQRNEEIKEFSKNLDAILVVGGKESANTIELYLKAKEYCKNVWHIENYNEIPTEISKFQTVGLFSGSSTPRYVLDKIQEELNSLL